MGKTESIDGEKPEFINVRRAPFDLRCYEIQTSDFYMGCQT